MVLLLRFLRLPRLIPVISDPDVEPERPDGLAAAWVTVRCVDTEMDASEWTVRFGGTPDELFDEADADTLIAVGREHPTLKGVVVRCSQGVSRSTAAATVIAGAADRIGPYQAVTSSIEAQARSFEWRDHAKWLPNRRILSIGSRRLYGDDRLRRSSPASGLQPGRVSGTETSGPRV